MKTVKSATALFLAVLFCFSLVFSPFFNVKAEAATVPSQLIIVNKKTNQLAYYEEGKLVKVYPVATGKKRSYTPEGKFKIVNKIKNRPYYKLRIPGGDPRNPLGARWLGLNAGGRPKGDTYAIHGTNDPKSIGKYASAGCIRMYNKDVIELYNRVKLNTPVIITYSSTSFKNIAKSYGYQVR